MKSIYKYPVLVTGAGKFSRLMPEGAQILTVQVQHTEPCIWALVDVDAVCTTRRQFVWIGTGHKSEHENAQYIGTIQELGGSLIWHLFELTD